MTTDDMIDWLYARPEAQGLKKHQIVEIALERWIAELKRCEKETLP